MSEMNIDTYQTFNSIAVLRSDNIEKIKGTLFDLVEYGDLSFVGNPKIIDTDYADNVLVNVMKKPLRTHCLAAAAILLEEDASTAIDRIRKIHARSHIIIVSRKHEIYDDIMIKMSTIDKEIII